jgi:hypothetical protein
MGDRAMTNQRALDGSDRSEDERPPTEQLLDSQSARTACKVGVFAAVGIAIGSVLPWVSVQSGSGSIDGSRIGISGGGSGSLSVLALAVFIALLVDLLAFPQSSFRQIIRLSAMLVGILCVIGAIVTTYELLDGFGVTDIALRPSAGVFVEAVSGSVLAIAMLCALPWGARSLSRRDETGERP